MKNKKKNKSEKKLAPIICAAVFIVLFSGIIGVMLMLNFTDEFLPVVAIFYIVISLTAIIGIIIALVQRIKEINGGETDEALKY